MPSTAGYQGALGLLIGVIILGLTGPDSPYPIRWDDWLTDPLILPLYLAFSLMLSAELSHQRQRAAHRPRRTPAHLLRSALFRYLSLLILVGSAAGLVLNHYYFQSDAFAFTRTCYGLFFTATLVLGFPFILFTLWRKGAYREDFNDALMLGLIGARAALRRLAGHLTGRHDWRAQGRRRLRNRRVVKVALIWLVSVFFLTLMTRFFASEYNALTAATRTLANVWTDDASGFARFHAVYTLLFHALFVVDTGLAVIAYSASSRWLDNRIRSVDRTAFGWTSALLCYPPFNSGVTDQFIGYGVFQTQPVVEAEWIRMLLMILILLCYAIYVWATMALGFKFGNLVHRGIVTTGPYAYFRHPAYASKNFAWWLDNTQVLSSLGASLALLAWNGVYVLRALTEERHLRQFKPYQAYMAKVRRRFVPLQPSSDASCRSTDGG